MSSEVKNLLILPVERTNVERTKIVVAQELRSECHEGSEFRIAKGKGFHTGIRCVEAQRRTQSLAHSISFVISM